MGMEDMPSEVPAPELPETESFTPIESVSELSLEAGSIFDVVSKDGNNVLESGTILGIFEDEKYGGGGYLQVELKKGEGNESRTGKLTFDKFLEFYNRERVSGFQNPSKEDEGDMTDVTDQEFGLPANSEPGNQLTEQISQLDPDLDPQFASYLGEVIERKGIDQVKAVVGKMTENDKQVLQQELAKENLPGFTYRMELIFDQETDPDWKEKQQRSLDDSLSGDPQRVMRATRERSQKFANHVELTGRHAKPRTEKEAVIQKELAIVLSKLTGRRIEESK